MDPTCFGAKWNAIRGIENDYNEQLLAADNGEYAFMVSRIRQDQQLYCNNEMMNSVSDFEYLGFH